MDMKVGIKEFFPKMKTYFSTFPWRNTLFFFLFLLLAFIFWLMLFFQTENVDGTYRIPLKYTNVPMDVVFDNPIPQFIDISVTDRGSEIFSLDITRKDSLEIDVTELAESGQTSLQGDQLRQYIRTYLSPSTNIRGYYPMNISLSTSKLESKQLTVTFDGEITTSRANLIADSATFIPETVTAYGSKTSLAMLQTAATEYTVFQNLKATSQLPININSVEGVRFSPPVVDIFIPIMEYTEQTFEVPIEASNMPSNLDVKFFPSRAKVSFSVTLEDYRQISQEDFSIVLDYREFRDNENGRVQLELTQSPSFIVEPRLNPSSVEFLFENNGS